MIRGDIIPSTSSKSTTEKSSDSQIISRIKNKLIKISSESTTEITTNKTPYDKNIESEFSVTSFLNQSDSSMNGFDSNNDKESNSDTEIDSITSNKTESDNKSQISAIYNL